MATRKSFKELHATMKFQRQNLKWKYHQKKQKIYTKNKERTGKLTSQTLKVITKKKIHTNNPKK